MPISFKLLLALAIIVLIIVFSPLVLAYGQIGPWFLGMPRVLWAGILASFILALITFGLSLSLKSYSRKESLEKRQKS